MSQYVNVSNSWRLVKHSYINVSGSWKSCNNIYININGTWRPLHAYWWAVGNWGGCSASCGGGWQYRTVNCYRSYSSNHSLDHVAVDDSYCTRNVGAKPVTQQQCNTQSCNECKYSRNQYHWFVHTKNSTAKDMEIIWANNSVYKAVGGSLQTITTGGYKYNRNGTYKDRVSIGNKEYYYYYEVCRSPV